MSQTSFQSLQRENPPSLFSEEALWLCENRRTRYKTKINGPLAEILQQYPADYRLRLLSIKSPQEAEHVQPA